MNSIVDVNIHEVIKISDSNNNSKTPKFKSNNTPKFSSTQTN